MFVISSVPKKYQQVIQQTLQDIEGVQNISDDIIIQGATQERHDERLQKVMTLNADTAKLSERR